MREVTLLHSANALPLDGRNSGRTIVVDDEETSCTRMIYLLLALCGRAGVQECTLDPDARHNCLQCKHRSGDYLTEDDILPPPSHVRHYLVYHSLMLACPTAFASRLYWAIAQIVPGAIKARIHVRYKETTYQWNAVFRRRAVIFRLAQ